MIIICGTIHPKRNKKESVNNFEKYRCETYFYNSELSDEVIKTGMGITLELKYDDNGNPIYGDCSIK